LGEPTVLIRGGEIVTATDMCHADVLVRGDKIEAISIPNGSTADRVIDATGCYVMPGGIDVHTHLEEPMDWTTRTADDFITGTVGAAFGGTTTIIDFAKRHPDCGLYESHERRMELADGKPVIDYGFHAMVTSAGLTDGGLDDLRRLAHEGVTSWKFFMAYRDRMMVDDETILAAMHLAAELGTLIMVHAENGAIVADAMQRLIDAGRTEEHMHLAAHPHLAEGEAAHRAIALAELADCPLFIVHVSSRLAAREVGAARARGRPVWGETCPQYLVKSYEDYRGLGFEAAKFVCSPPIRERANQEYLWEALATGVLSTIGTDHASFRMKDDLDLPPQKPKGRGYFPRIPNGVPGIEDRLMVLYEAGVRGGHFGLPRFVDLVSTRPAKLFGLYPRKGAIAPGSDADIVIWDPNAYHTISADTHHMQVDYNLYEGMVVSGKPRQVISRGEVIVDGNTFLGKPGRGQHLVRCGVNGN